MAGIKLNPREKVLAGIVAGIVFLLFNLAFLRFALQKNTQLRIDLDSKAAELKGMRVLLSERDLWIKRDAWLEKNQPPLKNEGEAGVELLNQMKEIGKSNDVVLENPAIGVPEKTLSYRAVPISVETKSSWESLIKFLAAVQQPSQFIVFESANLQIDSKDASAMRGKFKIARWYAP